MSRLLSLCGFWYGLTRLLSPDTWRNFFVTAGHMKRNIRNTSTLDMQEVDIIVYDFTLTKAGRLRKSTIDIIKEKLPSLQGFSDRRRTRSTTHDLEAHHLVLDEDNALIGTSDDDEDESPLYTLGSIVAILMVGITLDCIFGMKKLD